MALAMPPRDLDEIRRLELRVRELRRGRPLDPETARFNERVAEGLRLTGDMIRWMRTGVRAGEGLARRARLVRVIEEIGLERPRPGSNE
jgi:hypothetical protein